ncbi:TetR/AcrR family transcriptional regulator [Sphingomonas endolithica]|uniref:TetR/AcrR family transcriptional regulator n=1 Tax=Sphingomonas endolithica TaxID=2972485 RepID=UPI0021AFB51F|nr:TetR/AcrR family transcriptional regulator [Sphingomonas sp. ZFBP2030]
MPRLAARPLSPRKTPIQSRSAATLEAIFEATIQVLVAEGSKELTTTRVAHRAGVSVGTLYQYFPNKQALFYAVNQRYLGAVASRVEETCLRHHGAPLAEMVDTLIEAYWQAKFERPDVTRALYRSVADLDMAPLIGPFTRRVDAATAAMLATAPGATFADVGLTSLTLLTAVFGTVKGVFERELALPLARGVHEQLTQMCLAYLEGAKTPTAADIPELV